MKITGPWDSVQVESFLADAAVPLRLSVLDGTGWPLVVSLWFLHAEGALWCATPRSARIVTHLQNDPRCAFEIAPDTPPYRGVRGQARGEVRPADGEHVLLALLERYGQTGTRLGVWLRSRVAIEVALRLEPIRFNTWDFSERMGAPTQPAG